VGKNKKSDTGDYEKHPVTQGTGNYEKPVSKEDPKEPVRKEDDFETQKLPPELRNRPGQEDNNVPL
jgi:hypothetical protein